MNAPTIHPTAQHLNTLEAEHARFKRALETLRDTMITDLQGETTLNRLLAYRRLVHDTAHGALSGRDAT